MNSLYIILFVFLAYLIGSINGSLVLGRIKNVDVRKSGSGNAGGTNAFRAQGFKFALAVIAIDIGKALLVVYLAKSFLPGFIANANLVICLCAVAVVIGHCYPIWHGFKGGKGVATFAGVVIALIPQYFPLLFLILVVILILTGYVSLASIFASLCVPIVYVVVTPDYVQQPLFWCLFFISLFIVFTHRGNVRKLLTGTENRFEKIRLLHRFLKR